ncbi:MAG: DUF2059 domain-containing protein [Cyanobacteria bacterium SBLK]|nr:DUF2059 domain-containing protein [Cyanobacteria bacterium SBLK]
MILHDRRNLPVIAAVLTFFLTGWTTPKAIAAQIPTTPTRADETQISQNPPQNELDAASLENLEQTIPSAKWQLIQQLVELTQSSQLLDQMLGSLFGSGSDSMLEQMLVQSQRYQSATEEERQEMLAQGRRMQARMYELMIEEVNVIEITRNIEIYLYNKYYTEEDLANLLVFYQTPTGQKLIETLPRMAQDSVDLSTRLVLPRMMGVLQQLMEELGEMTGN